jgi:hypothetical protein
MGIDGDKTRMTDHVRARGRNHLLEGYTDGTVNPSSYMKAWNTMVREYVFTNCDSSPDQG